MSNWSKVGDWLKENATDGAKLVGSLLTGNYAGAIAAGVGMVSSATGSNNPDEVLASLKSNPETLIRLKEIAAQQEQDVRMHIQEMTRIELEDQQKEHEQTQITIRAGDASTDEKIRLIRPDMAKQSWLATICYCIGCFGVRAITGDDIFDIMMATILSSPAWAYLGLRTGDKFAAAWKDRKQGGK